MIRTQDRMSLVPIGKVSIEKGNGFFTIRNYPFVGGGTNCGCYNSEARCLEVLDEIQKSFGNYMRVDVNNVPTKLFDYPKIYEMPEK